MGYVTIPPVNVKNINVGPASKFEGFLDDTTTLWENCQIGWIPRRCFYSNTWLWPFTKATQRCLTHVSNNGLYSKRFYALEEQAIIANLKMEH